MTEEFRVFGPPGTGKTTRLSRMVSRAVELYGPDGVVVASFTKAAATELQGRDLQVNPSHVGTLHALCYRALGSPEIAEVHVKEFNESQATYHLTGEGLDLDEPEQSFDTEADRIFADYQVLRARMVPSDRWTREVQSFSYAWESWKNASELIDFTDMIELALDLRVPPPEGARIGFFDEVQDFTRLELALLRQWGQHLDRLVLAGDDDQCIYGFKGAEPEAFLDPPIPDGDPHKEILAQSYRMPSAIHAVTQRWIAMVGVREPKEFTPRDYAGAVEKRPDMRYRAPDAMVEEAIDAADGGRTVMMLGSCSYQVAYMVGALRRRGALFHNPYRRKRGDWNPLRPARGRSASQRLLSLVSFDGAAHGDAAHPWTYGDLADWLPLVKKTGVFRRGATKSLDDQAKDRTVSAATLQYLFEDGVVDAIHTNPLGWVAEHVASERHKGLEYPLIVAAKRGLATLADPAPRIVVGTIHSVKGGESDDVYLLPDLSPAGFVEYSNDATRDGVLRQIYVGMSRAKERLVLCGPSTPSAVAWLR